MGSSNGQGAMNRTIGWIVVLLVVLVGGYLLFGRDSAAPAEETGLIKLGVMQPLTGDAASYGESEVRAIQVAVEEINAAGGVNGRQFELVTEDSKCDPQAGGTAAQKLVSVDQVKIILGGACSGETLAASKITEPAKVLIMSPSASSPDVSTAGDFVFRTYPSDALAGKVAAAYAYKELGARKAAVLTELTDYAQGLRRVYSEAFKGYGGEVVFDETYTTGDTDFRTLVLKIKESGADVVYVVPQTPTPGVSIFKQLRENEVSVKYTTAEVLMDRQIVKDNEDVLDAVIGVEVAVDYENNAKAKAFKAAHLAKFNVEPGSFAANAYDAVYLVAEGMKAVGTNTEALRDWLYQVKDWPGAVGAVTMDANGDPIIGLSVRKIVSGEVTDLGPYTP